MQPLQNDRYLRALLRQPVDTTPVWMMRQAGRYLPEYKATRAEAGDFMSLCKNAELACEVTLQPLRRFDLDAAILFSDILTIPDAMGLGLYFETGEGPKFERPLTCMADIQKLPVLDPEVELGYVMNAVRTIRKNLNGTVPLIGFSGSPWTLATYMIEGGSSKAFTKIKKMAFSDPQALHKIVDALTRENDGRKVPVTLFTKNAGLWLESIAATGCDAVGLDWTVDMADAKARIGDKVALQGNMDPSMLYAPAARIEQEVQLILDGFGKGNGHVFNLGHGIHLDVPPENAKVFIDAVHRLSKPFHQ